jgi:hypothetical protein
LPSARYRPEIRRSGFKYLLTHERHGLIAINVASPYFPHYCLMHAIMTYTPWLFWCVRMPAPGISAAGRSTACADRRAQRRRVDGDQQPPLPWGPNVQAWYVCPYVSSATGLETFFGSPLARRSHNGAVCLRLMEREIEQSREAVIACHRWVPLVCAHARLCDLGCRCNICV